MRLLKNGNFGTSVMFHDLHIEKTEKKQKQNYFLNVINCFVF